MQRVLDNIEAIVAVGESFELRVNGYSMLPLLGYAGDTIIVRRVSVDESIAGRIAMFRGVKGNIIVHRVLSVDSGEVRLRGDGNTAQIESVQRAEIIGVVESVRRRGGRVVSCTSRWWHLKERLWLAIPLRIRGYLLALLRRMLDYKYNKG
ncbi:MAG: S24/S26 family peptidase [Alistipes sp.]|nr:S24/S26 family peptidase [Alistipes sp.]